MLVVDSVLSFFCADINSAEGASPGFGASLRSFGATPTEMVKPIMIPIKINMCFIKRTPP
jgi:hypothetical protein